MLLIYLTRNVALNSFRFELFSFVQNKSHVDPKTFFLMGWTWVAGTTWNYFGVLQDCCRAVLDWETQTSVFRDGNPGWLPVIFWVLETAKEQFYRTVVLTMENISNNVFFAICKSHWSRTNGPMPLCERRFTLQLNLTEPERIHAQSNLFGFGIKLLFSYCCSLTLLFPVRVFPMVLCRLKPEDSYCRTTWPMKLVYPRL